MLLIIVLFFMDESIIINDNRYINFVKAFKMFRLVTIFILIKDETSLCS